MLDLFSLIGYTRNLVHKRSISGIFAVSAKLHVFTCRYCSHLTPIPTSRWQPSSVLDWLSRPPLDPSWHAPLALASDPLADQGFENPALSRSWRVQRWPDSQQLPLRQARSPLVKSSRFDPSLPNRLVLPHLKQRDRNWR